MKGVTCNQCGWVHMEVSREFAEGFIDEFNEYVVLTYPTPEERKAQYGRETTEIAAIEDFEHCNRCSASYKDFRDTVVGDAPDGSTLNPILNRNE